MRLAVRAGLNVASVSLEHVAGKDVLLVERFDRVKTRDGWTRKAMVSALTLFGLDEMMARYASYEDLAEIIRHRFTSPKATLRELYGRLVFNILCGNTDDHARNHAGFWDGEQLTLTPAYDICPQSRTGNVASQAMLIVGDNRTSPQWRPALRPRPISSSARKRQRRSSTGRSVPSGTDGTTSARKPELTEVERNLFGQRMFLNDFIFEGTAEDLQ